MGTPLGYTTKFSRHLSGAWGYSTINRHLSGAWGVSPAVWENIAGTWTMRASTPTVTAGGGGANTSSGASTSGTASVGLTATPGGTNTGNLSYHWYRASGSNYSIDNATAQNPNVSYVFSGVADGTTDSLASEQWYCVITDNVTGATYQSDNITVGPLAWQNTIPAFSPHTDVYTSGSGNATIPAGAVQVVITVIGAGGGGGGCGAYNSSQGYYEPSGGGGGAGGYSQRTISLSGDASKTLAYAVGAAGAPSGAGGNSTVTGTLTAGSVSMAGDGGGGGQNAGTTAGTGGSASGGDTNTAGGNGGSGSNFSQAAGGTSAASSLGGDGGASGDPNTGSGGQYGASGYISFAWT
jgi:hypothetical protein